ncbi:MAG: hypothetical protein JNK05_40185 [Myxococcales bacterium]|nr:hypothetical protein [Myxococcales bacterium]
MTRLTIRASAIAVALFALQCRSPATAVVVSVSLERTIADAQPVAVSVRAASIENAEMFATFRLTRGLPPGNGRTVTFPTSFTIVPKSGGPRNGLVAAFFDVELPPQAGGPTLRWTQRMRFQFTQGATMQARIVLSPACGRQSHECPASNPQCTLADVCESRGMTCGQGGVCMPLDTALTEFEADAEFAPLDATGTPMDARVGDASSDAASSDGGDSGDIDASNDTGTSGEDVITRQPDAGCTPMCTGRACGDDQCGGSCGSCAPRPNMVPSCSAAGQCQYTCQMGFGDCDSNPANGCETALNTDANCGMCGRACSGATPVCGGSSCGTGCPPGQSRCGGACVDTQTDVANCGMCGRTCSLANASAACTAGNCRVAMCNSGFGDCDSNAANGCETSLNTAMNCGVCGRACSGATPNCNTSTGMCTSGCTGAQVRCGTACVDTTTDESNCGSCGNACPSRPNAAVSCAASACRYTCNAGFGDCDGNMANGCETALNSTTHCGMCGRACSFANGSASCTAGSCALAGCTTGFGNCDGNMTNGCETPLNSTTHCGMCSRACAVANGAATCASGTCQVASCNGGFGNCDGNPANGCETNTTNTPAHCSNCGNGCPSRANASTTCSSSTCGFSCTSGFADCNSNGADGCEANLGTISNCGVCGRVCSFANATALCSAGSCALGACNAGWANCDGNPANGCETPTNTTTDCGGCGVACVSGQTCDGTSCNCPGGQSVCGSSCQTTPGTACTRQCYTGAAFQCSSGVSSCQGGTQVPNGTSCGVADGRICNNGSCVCPGGQCLRCGECQSCTGPCR